MKFIRHIAMHTLQWFLVFLVGIVLPIFVFSSVTQIVAGEFSYNALLMTLWQLSKLMGLLLLLSLVAGAYFGSVVAWADRNR